jgi:stage III sporulation protein AF
MVNFMKDWVLNIITLVLFIVMIEILLPSGKMKKYVNLVTGFILIIAIINPFLKLLGNKVSLADTQLSDSNYIDRLEIEKDSKLLKQEQMKQITEVYRKKIIKQLEQSAMDMEGIADAKADVIINEDYNSGTFGEIKRAYLEISLKSGDNVIKPVEKVQQVKIGNMNSVSKDEKKLDPVIKNKLEDKIVKLFNVDKENIVISQQTR